MTDEDVLIKFQSLIGGRLTGPHLQSDGDAKRYKVVPKPFWIWAVSSWDEFERIGQLLRPWLCGRRAARFDLVWAAKPARFRKAHASMPCDYAPTASIAGYLKHRRRGERACEVCLESYRMYQREYIPKWKAKQPKREPKPRTLVDHCSKPAEPSQAGRSIHLYRGTPICERCAESYRLWYREFRAKRSQRVADS